MHISLVILVVEFLLVVGCNVFINYWIPIFVRCRSDKHTRLDVKLVYKPGPHVSKSESLNFSKNKSCKLYFLACGLFLVANIGYSDAQRYGAWIGTDVEYLNDFDMEPNTFHYEDLPNDFYSKLSADKVVRMVHVLASPQKWEHYSQHLFCFQSVRVRWGSLKRHYTCWFWVDCFLIYLQQLWILSESCEGKRPRPTAYGASASDSDRGVDVMKLDMAPKRTKYANSLKKHEASKHNCTERFINFGNGESVLLYIHTVSENHLVFDKVITFLLIKGCGICITTQFTATPESKIQENQRLPSPVTISSKKRKFSDISSEKLNATDSIASELQKSRVQRQDFRERELQLQKYQLNMQKKCILLQ